MNFCCHKHTKLAPKKNNNYSSASPPGAQSRDECAPGRSKRQKQIVPDRETSGVPYVTTLSAPGVPESCPRTHFDTPITIRGRGRPSARTNVALRRGGRGGRGKQRNNTHTPGKVPAKLVCLVSCQLPCSASDLRRGIRTPNRVSDPRARYRVTCNFLI